MNNDLPPALIPVRKETGIKESTLFGLNIMGSINYNYVVNIIIQRFERHLSVYTVRPMKVDSLIPVAFLAGINAGGRSLFIIHYSLPRSHASIFCLL